MKRLLYSATSFTFVLMTYWVYALSAVPLIEPEAPGAKSSSSSWNPDKERQNLLAGLFPPGAWELEDPILIQIDRGKLLLQEYQNLGDGRVKIHPCTLVVFPEGPAENEDQRKRQAVILKAPQGAVLRFDSPLDLKTIKIGRLLGGQLLGKITIHSKGRDPGPDDDLLIITRDVQMSEREVWTEQPVEFRWGKTFGNGRRMRMKLKAGAPPPGGEWAAPSASGIERFELQQLERLHIDVPPAASASQAPQTAPAAGPQHAAPLKLPPGTGGRPLEITCRGPFCFQQSDWSASFHDHVEVRQINPQGPADQLLGDLLTLYFAPRASGIDPATASPKDMEPCRVKLQGQPALVNAPSQAGGVTAQGDRIEYDLRENRFLLESSIEVSLKKGEQEEIHTRRLEYQSLGPRSLGKATAQGPGWLRGNDPNHPQESLRVQWQDQLRLSPENGNPVISVSGGGELIYSRLGSLKAQEIVFRLAEVPPVNRSAAPTWRPQQMQARKNVEIQSPQLSGSVEELTVLFEPASSRNGSRNDSPRSSRCAAPGEERGMRAEDSLVVGRRSPVADDQRPVIHQSSIDGSCATGGLSASAENKARTGWQAARGTRQSKMDETLATHDQRSRIHVVSYNAASDPPAPPPRHFHVTGRSLQARVQIRDPQSELSELDIEGGVCCQETQTLQPGEIPLRIRGDRLHVADASGPKALATVTGQPALCEGQGMTLSGSNINMHSGENRVWIDGPGRMVLLPDAVLSGLTAVPGQTAAAPGPLTIDWRRGMQFDGRTAKFAQGVVIFTPSQRVQTETLEAELDRTIRFNDPNLQNQPRPQVEKLFCHGEVWMENRSVDPPSLTRMHVTDLTMNLRSGAISAVGPGWINSVRYGSDPALQTPLTGSANKPNPPPAAADSSLYCMNVQFQGKLTGNLSKSHQHLVFAREIRGAYAPVASWEATLVPDQPERLGPKGITLECDQLTANQKRNPQGGSSALELIAEGNTVVEGSSFTARALRITYAQAKELLILEGNGRTDAQLFYQRQAGAPYYKVPARQIWYWRDTGRVNVVDARSVELNQLSNGGPKK